MHELNDRYYFVQVVELGGDDVAIRVRPMLESRCHIR
jgi:hypothetical protein